MMGYQAWASRNEYLRRARNAVFYASAPDMTESGRALWLDCARKFATAARRANWHYVRALRSYAP